MDRDFPEIVSPLYRYSINILMSPFFLKQIVVSIIIICGLCRYIKWPNSLLMLLPFGPKFLLPRSFHCEKKKQSNDEPSVYLISSHRVLKEEFISSYLYLGNIFFIENSCAHLNLGGKELIKGNFYLHSFRVSWTGKYKYWWLVFRKLEIV